MDIFKITLNSVQNVTIVAKNVSKEHLMIVHSVNKVIWEHYMLLNVNATLDIIILLIHLCVNYAILLVMDVLESLIQIAFNVHIIIIIQIILA